MVHSMARSPISARAIRHSNRTAIRRLRSNSNSTGLNMVHSMARSPISARAIRHSNRTAIRRLRSNSNSTGLIRRVDDRLPDTINEAVA
jgi:hypothetical protein